MPQRIAYAHERQVVGTLLLNLLFPIFEHNEAHLKRHFGASLETMTVGIAVLLAQLASRPASVVRVAQLLGVPRHWLSSERCAAFVKDNRRFCWTQRAINPVRGVRALGAGGLNLPLH